MNRTEWKRTPYAMTEAKNSERDLSKMFEKYGVTQYSFARGISNDGPAYQVRFVLNEKPYKMMLEGLGADNVKEEEKIAQIQRVLYYQIKSMFELSTVFLTAEQVFFSFLELPEGRTVYEVAFPKMEQISGGDLKGFLP